jgi:hypothetical protein
MAIAKSQRRTQTKRQPGGSVKAEGLGDGPSHRQSAIAKLRRLRLTLPPTQFRGLAFALRRGATLLLGVRAGGAASSYYHAIGPKRKMPGGLGAEHPGVFGVSRLRGSQYGRMMIRPYPPEGGTPNVLRQTSQKRLTRLMPVAGVWELP